MKVKFYAGNRQTGACPMENDQGHEGSKINAKQVTVGGARCA